MLTDSIQDIKMSSQDKLKLQIHHSNLFRPNPIGANLLAWGVDSNLLAVVKAPKADGAKRHANIIEIYDTTLSLAPRLMGSIICHENITGAAWVGFHHILTTSKEQTICIYSVKELRRIYSTITDYGAILSLKYYKNQSLILTSTEYGYVAAYRVSPYSRSVELISKMVKINSKIVSVVASIKLREDKVNQTEKESSIKKTRKRKRSKAECGDETFTDKDTPSLEPYDITVFGATEGNVVAWDFHKTTIIETVHVCDEPHTVNCILALARGDIITGDSSGVMSIIDCSSYTCLRTIRVSQFSITTIGASPKEDKLLVSGEDPTIHIMKRGEIDARDFRFFEKARVHTQPVTSILFVNKTDFFSISINGVMVRFKMDGESRKLDKYPFIPVHLSSRVKFLDGEQLSQNDSSIVIWKLPKIGNIIEEGEGMDIEDEKITPVKHILIRSKRYIYSTTFSHKWIVYATSENCCILDRANCNEVRHPSKKLPGCTHLELCDNDQYLVSAIGRSLVITDLENIVEENDKKDRLVKKFKIVAEHSMRTAVIQLLYLKNHNLLAVLCGQPKFGICFFKVERGSKKNFHQTDTVMFDNYRLSFITYNKFDTNDKIIYAYSNENEIIKLDPVSSSTELSDEITGLPDDVHITDMLVLPNDQCILYDTRRIFRVDMKSNQMLSINTDYAYILRMDFLSNNPNQVALAEVLPEDYESSFPKLTIKNGYGKRYGVS